jgi:hypothetical protein
MSSFVTETAAKRPRQIFAGLLLVATAVGVGWLATLAFWEPFVGRLGSFNIGTVVYKRAQWVSTVSMAALFAVTLAVASWLVSVGLRRALGLPGRPVRWLALRSFVAVPVLGWLLFRAADEWMNRYHSVEWPIGIGLGVCLLFAADVPRILADVVAVWRLRAPLLAARRRSIAQARAGERVWLRGVVTGVEGAELTLRDKDGETVVVDLDPARLVVEGAPPATGATVDAIGTMAGESDAYRGDKRLGAGRGRLFLFVDAQAMHRRFLVAAGVETLAVLGLLAAPIGYLVAVVYVAKLAVHRRWRPVRCRIDGHSRVRSADSRLSRGNLARCGRRRRGLRAVQ